MKQKPHVSAAFHTQCVEAHWCISGETRLALGLVGRLSHGEIVAPCLPPTAPVRGSQEPRQAQEWTQARVFKVK